MQNIVTPSIGTNLDAEDVDLSNPTPETRLEGFFDSVKEGLLNGPTENTVTALDNQLSILSEPTKFLTQKEWEQSQWQRKGLSFPFGVAENVARSAAKDQDAEQLRQATLSKMEPGFISGVVKFGGSATAFFADPLNIAANIFAPAYIGVKKLEMAEALSDRVVSGLTRGAMVGAAVLAPQAVSQMAKSISEGQPPSMLDALFTIGMGASIGAVIHGLIATRPIISSAFNNAAAQSATEQMTNDIRPDASYVVKDGYNDASETFAGNINAKFDANSINANELSAEGLAQKFEPLKGGATNELITPKEVKETPNFTDDEINTLSERLKETKPYIEDPEDHLKALEVIKNSPFVPQTLEAMKSYLSDMRTLGRDSAYHPDFINQMNDLLKFQTDERFPGFDEIDQTVKELQSKGVLSEEDAKTIEELDETDKNNDAIESAIRDFNECIGGR